MDILQTIEIDDKIVNIYCDEDPQNPRTDWDHDDVMALKHRRYLFPFECPKYEFDNWDELKNCIVNNNDVAEILPVYMYDHSGTAFSTEPFSCHWDSGQIGWIYITKDKVRESHMVKRITKKVKEIVHNNLLASVKLYQQYSNGECYGYIVSDKDDNVIESCWGFYGWDEVIEVATEAGKNCRVVKPEDPRQLKLFLDVV